MGWRTGSRTEGGNLLPASNMTHMRTVGRVTVLAVVASALSAVAPAAPAATPVPCTDRTDLAYGMHRLVGRHGLFARPDRAPQALVVFAHGYRKPARVYWGPSLRVTARRGALAVAMDYRGIGGPPDYRGWNVRTGAADSIRAARFFVARCRSIRRVILVGVSMGANIAGYALAQRPTRPDGRPLFDYWIDVEGATNVTETYLAASAIAPGNRYAAEASEDIEAEMGGTIAEVPQRYREATIVLRAGDIAAGGLKGAVVVHGVEDGLVPYNQSREMAAALRAEGIPTEFTTVLTQRRPRRGTQISDYFLGAAGIEEESPFAGHGSEEDRGHLVINTAFRRLWAMLRGERPADRERVVDDHAGTVEPGS